jgi:hypothetical protein
MNDIISEIFYWNNTDDMHDKNKQVGYKKIVNNEVKAQWGKETEYFYKDDYIETK